jgi:2'-5' RNA ligase
MDRPQPSSGGDRRLELVVVALPTQDDTVRQYSSEKEPHLTLLYLGESSVSPTELNHAAEYIEHAASQLTTFGLEVERRGVLGDKDADVLFFEKRWAKRLVNFRSHLLQDQLINRLYHSTDQYPEWTPHLTMGYPEKPAKKDTREYQRFSYVRFDRIALWTGDSVGPTFQLKTDDDMEVAMSQTGESIAAAVLADLNEDAVQYGVPGMKWGKRKASSGPGSGRPASKDSTRAEKAKQVVKKSGVQALSNDDLKALTKRMSLEQELGRLTPPGKIKKGRMFVTKTLGNIGQQQLNMVLNQAVNQQVAKVLKGK